MLPSLPDMMLCLGAHRRHNAALSKSRCRGPTAVSQRPSASLSKPFDDAATPLACCGTLPRPPRLPWLLTLCVTSAVRPASRAPHLHRAAGEQAAHGGLVRRAQGLVQERDPVLQAVPQRPVPHLLHVARHALRRHLAAGAVHSAISNCSAMYARGHHCAADLSPSNPTEARAA